ncbi:MAG: hypothetical protein MH321_09280 [Leptospiraceae bacterium]|nr:hypothetical protein [Leptospiraceae bacterium]
MNFKSQIRLFTLQHFFYSSRYIKLIFLLIFCISNCRLSQEIAKNNLQVETERDKGSFTITEFNASGKKVIILFAPSIWKAEILFEENHSLVPYLAKYGYRVYLVQISSQENHQLKSSEALQEILNTESIEDYDLGGISTGGWHLTQIYKDWPRDRPKARKIFFLATGLDYNYEKSFPILYKEFNLKANFTPYPQYFLDPSLNQYWLGGKIEQIVPRADLDLPQEIPIAFFWGKIDSISPSESIYPVYEKIRNPKLWKELSIANGHSKDYDHGNLLLDQDTKDDVFSEIVSWLKD